MVKNKSGNTISGSKKILFGVSFAVTLLALFFGGNALLQWNEFKPYNKIANELNETLGGGYRITKNWYCGIESNNCPSVRMIKDVDFKDNDEAKAFIANSIKDLESINFSVVENGVCEPWDNDPVYCSVTLRKGELVQKVLAKKTYIGIDIQP